MDTYPDESHLPLPPEGYDTEIIYCIACNEEYSLPEDTEICPICGCNLDDGE